MSSKLRIDDGIMTLLANSGTDITKQGYLRKRGVNSKSFLRRWFVLKRNMLFYFEKRGEAKPLGVIILEGIVVRSSTNFGGYVFEIASIDGEDRSYFFETNSKSEIESWSYCLSRASYEYMRKRFNFLRIKYTNLIKTKQRENENMSQDEPRSNTDVSVMTTDKPVVRLNERKLENEYD